MTKTYEPLIGTIPYACVQFMRRLPPGSQVKSVELADCIGQSGMSLTPYLTLAIDTGLIVVHKTCGSRNVAYSLNETAEAIGQRAEQEALRIALWSDGQLIFERKGERMVFSVAETRQIVAYLERMAEESHV